MEDLKTGYEWCLLGNMRILDIMSWSTDKMSREASYHEEKITSFPLSVCQLFCNIVII